MNGNIRTRLLVVSAEPARETATSVSEAVSMLDDALRAAPAGFRSAWELAESLSGPYDVILAVPEKTLLSHPDFAVVYFNRRNIGLLAHDSEVVICPVSVIERHPFLVEEVQPVRVGLEELRGAGLGGILAGTGIADQPPGSATGELAVWRSPGAQSHKGIRYYMGRLRYHLRAGGARTAARQSGSLIKRKIDSKE